MNEIAEIKTEIEKIKIRNLRVEADKAWEGSFTRRLLLIVFTYLAIGLYMSAIKVNDPWLNAIVPSVGFLLSTLTLGFFKSFWLKHYDKSGIKDK